MSAVRVRTDQLDRFTLLADPLRRRIVELLADEQRCTCHLVELTGASQPTVSHHLRMLREAGWVAADRVGRYTYYRLRPEPLRTAATVLDDLADRAVGAARRRTPCD